MFQPAQCAVQCTVLEHERVVSSTQKFKSVNDNVLNWALQTYTILAVLSQMESIKHAVFQEFRNFIEAGASPGKSKKLNGNTYVTIKTKRSSRSVLLILFIVSSPTCHWHSTAVLSTDCTQHVQEPIRCRESCFKRNVQSLCFIVRSSDLFCVEYDHVDYEIVFYCLFC